MSSARAKQPPNRANSTPNISARGAADGSGRRVSEPHNAGRRISETTVINADARMHHALPTLQSTGHSSITDYMTPTSARGVEASKRLGVKRDNRLSVSVRIRPMNKADNNVSEVAVHPEGMFNIKLARPGGGDALAYAFDNVFVGGQDEVYDCIGKPMLQNAYEGYNVTLFAYGQTGSGKTHSILGPDGTLTHNSPKEEGFVPRFCKALLGYAQVRLAEEATLSLRITMSMVEVYNEEIRDLLENKKKGQSDLTELQLRFDKEGKNYIDGVSVHTILTYDRVVDLIVRGFDSRKVAATDMNQRSSRSHCIIILKLLQKHEQGAGKRDLESTINIVDLAGSERQGKTGVTGEQAVQAKNINLSLMTLGRVLNCLSEGHGVPPLRDSKLTRILADSFGGNARTWMLACVSGSAYNWQESMSTLSYAASAKKIVNKAHVNAMMQKIEDREKLRQVQMELMERMKEIQRLQEEVEKWKAAAEGRLPRTKSNEMDPGFGMIATAFGGDIFIGRAKLSLKNCVLQYSGYNTLPLVVQREEHDGATLIVKTWPINEEGEVKELPDINTALDTHRGKRFDFCVSIISAEGIPEGYTKRVFCRYVFAQKEEKPMQTEDQSDTRVPKWDYRKRFAWSKFDDELGHYLCGEVLTFEVIGFPQ